MMDVRTTALTPQTKELAFALVVTALVFYFGYFAVFGKHGLTNLMHLEEEVALKKAELDRIKIERAALEHRVSLLRPQSVDPDLLEEQARAKLGLTEPDEVVILKGKK